MLASVRGLPSRRHGVPAGIMWANVIVVSRSPGRLIIKLRVAVRSCLMGAVSSGRASASSVIQACGWSISSALDGLQLVGTVVARVVDGGGGGMRVIWGNGRGSASCGIAQNADLPGDDGGFAMCASHCCERVV